MTKQEALAILKPSENSFEALKTAYRTASKTHHPDFGGDVEIMKLVNEAYEVLNACDWTISDQAEADKETPLTDTMQEKLGAIRNLEGIKAEIIGTWLWVSGNTYIHKKPIKAAGFKFSGSKKTWYYHETAFRKFSKKSFSMDEIKSKFGSSEIKLNRSMSIA